MSACVCVRVVVNGSLDLTAREIVLQAFLFDLAKTDAATDFCCAGQMNRARGARVIRRSMVTEHCNCFVTRFRIYRFLCAASIKVSLARCYRWRAASTPSKYLACANHVSPRVERKVHNVSQARDAQPDRINTSGDRRPRRTLRAEAATYAMLARFSTRIT